MNRKSTKAKERVVRKTYDQIEKFTPGELQRLLDDRRDDEIDFSDIPRISPERIKAMQRGGAGLRRKRAG